MALLFWHQIVLLWRQVTMVAAEHLFKKIVQFDTTVVLPRQFATGRKYNYCSLVCILFEVLRIVKTKGYTYWWIYQIVPLRGNLDTIQKMGARISENNWPIYWFINEDRYRNVRASISGNGAIIVKTRACFTCTRQVFQAEIKTIFSNKWEDKI